MRLTGNAFLPSLQHIAFTKLGVGLWNKYEIKYLLAKRIISPNFPNRNVLISQWRIVRDKVVENAQKLPLPNSLKPEMSRYVRSVGWQILLWLLFHKNLYHDDLRVIAMLCWTSRGTIDHIKTAEMLVQDENIALCKRYAFACLYCLEETIPTLSATVGFKILDESVAKLSISAIKDLVLLWSSYLQGKFPWAYHHLFLREPHSPITFASYGLYIAKHMGNVAAMRFFCDKFSPEEREITLVKTAREMMDKSSPVLPQLFIADALNFLLSAMKEDEQMLLLNDHLWKVLKGFLISPWQRCFIEIVEQSRSSFSEKSYYALLDMIIERGLEDCEDYDYQRLFLSYWQEISRDCRMYFVAEVIKKDGFMKLLTFGDEQLVTFVLRDVSVSQKEVLIFGSGEQNMCLQLIRMENWNMLKFFFEECLSSMDEVKDKIVQLKRDFKFYKQKFGEMLCCDYIWHNFFLLLDEFINRPNKRINEKDDISVKRSRQT